MADVFISYAREDRPRAAQVARALESFWDTEIPPDQTWADYIEGKLALPQSVWTQSERALKLDHRRC